MADSFSTDSENPFAAPASLSVDESQQQEGSIVEQDLRTFVGKNWSYYLNQWRSVLHGRDQKTGFNFVAFLFSGIWLPYRKMYFLTFVLYGVIIVEAVLEEIILVKTLNQPEISEGLSLITGLIVSIIVGMYANRWYLTHSRKVVDEVRAEHVDDETVRRVLKQRGGTNLLAGFGMFLLFLFVTLGVTVMLMLVLYPGEF